MSEPISIDLVQQLLGTLDLECAVCHRAIDRADFEGGRVLGLTGPLRATAAHVAHFFEGEQRTPDYDRSMRMLVFAWACQNNLPTKGPVI